MVLLGVSIYGVTSLKLDFDYNWFVPSGSYILDYADKEEMVVIRAIY